MKRAIAGQRGSVRGAPPEVLAPFASFGPEDEESIRESIRPAMVVFGGIGAILLLVVIGTALGLCIAVTFFLGEDGFPD